MTRDDVKKIEERAVDPVVRLLCYIAMQLEKPNGSGGQLTIVLCPHCQSSDTVIRDTRGIARHRQCRSCSQGFDTIGHELEMVQTKSPTAYQLARSRGASK